MSTSPDDITLAVRRRLAERISKSVRAHRDFRTIRREQLLWSISAPGCAQATLTSTEYTQVMLLRLEPGTTLPWLASAFAQEILVVEGQVHAEPAGHSVRTLGRWSLLLRRSAKAGVVRAAGASTTVLYVRQLLAAPATLPEPEASWWQLPAAALQCIGVEKRPWHEGFEGVQTLALWGTPDIVSMLVRFAPGAEVPDHRHAVHEDCLMLEGSMFLGDILLRAGDYQLAPAGGGHFGEMSDVGGTFFFHGAVDPVLVPPPRSQPVGQGEATRPERANTHPGRAPVSRPPRHTGTPFTITISMPLAARCGSS
jgi:quercetin dioxygenase-like cupin family protein